MKNIFRFRRVWILLALMLFCAVVIFWPRKQPTYNGYSIVHYETIYDSYPDWFNDYPALEEFGEWYIEFTHEEGFIEAQLSDQETKELEKILSGYDFIAEGKNIPNLEKSLRAYITPVAHFMIGINGEPYFLCINYRGTLITKETVDASIFTLYKAQQNKKGLWTMISPDDGKDFISERLYNDLDNFLKSLPSSSPGRAEYDFEHDFYRAGIEGRL